MRSLSNEQRELTALRELSSRLGADPLLVQASSGNISIKMDDLLWIKASSKWMIHADADDFLVAVGLSRARRCLREGSVIPEIAGKSAGGARASIETAMHAVLPQRVVIHVHSVNAIAWAVRENGSEQLSTRLAGLAWRWIPYTPSGAALACEIGNVLSSSPDTNVLVLGNHGLVVCGENCRAAERLLLEVESRLAIAPRPAPEGSLDYLTSRLPNSDWCIPHWPGMHALADRMSRGILAGGALYPCQAIFLPDTVPGLVHRFRGRSEEDGTRQMFRLLDEQGVVWSKRLPAAEQQMLFGLANVIRRLDATSAIRYLTAAEVEGVLHGGAESYRGAANVNCQAELRLG